MGPWIARQFTIAAAISAIGLSVSAETMPHDLEQSICGFKEPFIFWLWSRAAGSADPARVRGKANVEDVSLATRDDRTLRGYKLVSTAPAAQRGYLLVVQGNAMLADQIITDFQMFANMGYDVFVFDYRGYGRSEGIRRLRAMLSDYRDIIADLDARGYASRAFYGLSFGGILLLDALRDDRGEKSLIIDSSPSRLSDHGCPPEHDPVSNFPSGGASALVIVGQRDNVVSPAMSHALVKRARQAGAEVVSDPDFGHPFVDGHTRRRFEMIRAFLERQRSND